MEDSFRVRADKVFGSLGGDTASSVGVSSSLWCLGDEEIERREWNRNKDYVEEEGDRCLESGLPLVRNPLDPDLQDPSDDEEKEEEEEEDEDEEIDGGKKKRRRNNTSGAETSVDEYFDVQSNIGRDCTLDYEEEEDQYDKVAVGTEEQTGDRLYMRDVKVADYEIHDMDDQSNRKAYMEFFGNMRKKNTDSMMDETPVEIPESVVFTPRRKTEEGSVANMSESTGDINARSKRWSVGITAINQESEVSAMEEDEPCRAAVDEGRSVLGKPGRQYRARIIGDVDGDSI